MSGIKEKFWLDADKAGLLVIDVQEKLVPAMNAELYNQLVLHTNLLISGFKALELPTLASEQYPKGLGHTVAEVSEATNQVCIEKVAFSCCAEEVFLQTLEETGVSQVVVTGMETHVCVLQTVLDLLDRGYGVHLVRDAVCSRFKSDYENALDTAARAGAVISTTETVLFQLVRVAGTDAFKIISKLVRQRTP